MLSANSSSLCIYSQVSGSTVQVSFLTVAAFLVIVPAAQLGGQVFVPIVSVSESSCWPLCHSLDSACPFRALYTQPRPLYCQTLLLYHISGFCTHSPDLCTHSLCSVSQSPSYFPPVPSSLLPVPASGSTIPASVSPVKASVPIFKASVSTVPAPVQTVLASVSTVRPLHQQPRPLFQSSGLPVALRTSESWSLYPRGSASVLIYSISGCIVSTIRHTVETNSISRLSFRRCPDTSFKGAVSPECILNRLTGTYCKVWP
jgi:hypothetical protein